MRGEMDLSRLLSDLRPQLHEGEFVFASISRESFGRLTTMPLASFREAEGVSVVLGKPEADAAGLAYDFPCRMITLSAHSSLHAVGLLATVAGKLASAGISLNVVSAYHHDHLFVPSNRAGEAVSLLGELGRGAR